MFASHPRWPVRSTSGKPRSVKQLRAASAAAIALSFSVAGSLAATPPAHALTKAFVCPSIAPNSWCIDGERHSYITVISGQNNWFNNYLGSGSTSDGWWCSKILNQDNGAEYGRVCDFAKTVTTKIGNAPSSHMQPLIANGNNGSYQNIKGCARTSDSQTCGPNG